MQSPSAFVFILLAALVPVLAGAAQHSSREPKSGKLKISSPAFDPKTGIPRRYTCEGENVNPPLLIERIPPEAQSIALIMDDPDAPGKTWVHWVVYNIPASFRRIDEKSVPGRQGLNDYGNENYSGPCPPSGIHHYYFKVYALDTMLQLPAAATKQDLEKAMKGHVVARGELIGLYRKES